MIDQLLYDPRFKSKIKNCRQVLTGLGFVETRLNYFYVGGIHVEVRDVSEQERWEITDYRKGTKVTYRGVGSLELKHRLTFLTQPYFV